MLHFLAWTILLSRPISPEAFTSLPSFLSKPKPFAKKPSTSRPFVRHHLQRSSDAVGANHRNLACLSIGADGDFSVPVETGLNGANTGLKPTNPPILGSNGDSSVPDEMSMNGCDYSSNDADPKSGTPPFPIVLWRFTRPHTIIGSAIAIPSIFLLAAPTYQSFFTIRSLASLIYAAVPALFMNLYITGLNQITDVEIDKINVSASSIHLRHFESFVLRYSLSHFSEAISAHGQGRLETINSMDRGVGGIGDFYGHEFNPPSL